MCGIIGYVGSREPVSLLIDGLKCLEYRGYDSCGIAVLDNGTPKVLRSVGRVAGLEQMARERAVHPPGAVCGIGHTRWATHGRPSENNAHPHCDCSGHFLVAHNGIIENYSELRQRLVREGHCFRSETDTEVLPHLIERHFRGNLEEAVQATLREVEGAYGLVAVCTHDHAKIVAARRGAPLVLGLGEGENFVASDTLPLLPYTREMMFLDDAEVAVIRSHSVEVRNTQGYDVPRRPQTVTWSAEMASKEGYPHFMLKEIFEQPRAVQDTLLGRLDADLGVKLEDELNHLEQLRSAERLHIVACGTSWHAAQVGRFMIEDLAGLPVDVDYASEFRYRTPRLGPRDVVV
ncbi:MAG TPA: glutamine--fructose-6-phosphate transaminase (isomerizing), partial [Bryobacteraceae bacterium]|nr:glutamine--fructose-6-phosphate transaminase (isomerizing) [Bryobacteraceae bacterium]